MKTEVLSHLKRSLEAREAIALVTLLSGPKLGQQMLYWPGGRRVGGLGDPKLEAAIAELVAEQWLAMAAKRAHVESEHGAIDVFVDVFPPPPKLIVVGAVHAAINLVRMARELGFETIVVDPRTAFATEERFAHADRLLHEWPDEALLEVGVDANTFVVLLSHDLKLDVPALKVALPMARYVGALGSRKTQARRLERLREAGVPEVLYSRIHSPIGLDLGGRKAEEIAVSVIAQIVAVSHGRDTRPIPESKDS